IRGHACRRHPTGDLFQCRARDFARHLALMNLSNHTTELSLRGFGRVRPSGRTDKARYGRYALLVVLALLAGACTKSPVAPTGLQVTTISPTFGSTSGGTA